MSTVEFTDGLKNYELEYWDAHRNEENDRPLVMSSLFEDCIIDGQVAADIGCGPYCGIFNELKFTTMYAVDPLWTEYGNKGLIKKPNGVILIDDCAETFALPEKADVIFSFNALDHSGDLSNSFHNIMDNLQGSGTFYFHVHLRTKKQLNGGHRMVVLEEDIDNILKPYTTIDKKVLSECPLDKKNYVSYIAVVKK